MSTHTLMIAPEMEGKSIRVIALKWIGMSSGAFKRAKFQGSILLDGERVTADVRVKAGRGSSCLCRKRSWNVRRLWKCR